MSSDSQSLRIEERDKMRESSGQKTAKRLKAEIAVNLAAATSAVSGAVVEGLNTEPVNQVPNMPQVEIVRTVELNHDAPIDLGNGMVLKIDLESKKATIYEDHSYITQYQAEDIQQQTKSPLQAADELLNGGESMPFGGLADAAGEYANQKEEQRKAREFSESTHHISETSEPLPDDFFEKDTENMSSKIGSFKSMDGDGVQTNESEKENGTVHARNDSIPAPADKIKESSLLHSSSETVEMSDSDFKEMLKGRPIDSNGESLKDDAVLRDYLTGSSRPSTDSHEDHSNDLSIGR